jgi:hypothetical protein
VIGEIGFIDMIWSKCSAWIVAHAFWPEAISIAACPVAQYLGLKLGLQIDHSVVPPIPNIEPQAALEATESDIASGQNTWAL